MNYGDFVSLIINLGVGAYFVYFFPRQLNRQMPENKPRLFVYLEYLIPSIGYVLIGGTILYVLLILVGSSR